jgi:diguanylate cyclase (GGDEF)-like protein
VELRKDPNAIGSLARFEEPVSPEQENEALIERFQKEQAPGAVPVVEARSPLGIVHKTKLFYKLGQRFGYALFSQKQVRSIMEPVLVFDEGTPLEEVSREALSREESAVYDTVIVTRNGEYLGLVEMHRLYERITDQKILLAAQANPLTSLPGNNLIKQEITRRLDNSEIFAVVYVDLDHFKPFNDHHGFARGDSVLRFLGDLLKRSTLEWDFNGFVGHVGGDDFVVVCRGQGVETLCENILDRFDAEVKTFHDAGAVKRGYYEAPNRHGQLMRFPLLSLSLAVVSTRSRVIISYGQIVSIASEVKRQAKETPGSSYFIDRRHR